MIVNSSPIQQLATKSARFYSKSINITYMPVERSIMSMSNDGSKSSVKVKLLQDHPSGENHGSY